MESTVRIAFVSFIESNMRIKIRDTMRWEELGGIRRGVITLISVSALTGIASKLDRKKWRKAENGE